MRVKHQKKINNFKNFIRFFNLRCPADSFWTGSLCRKKNVV